MEGVILAHGFKVFSLQWLGSLVAKDIMITVHDRGGL